MKKLILAMCLTFACNTTSAPSEAPEASLSDLQFLIDFVDILDESGQLPHEGAREIKTRLYERVQVRLTERDRRQVEIKGALDWVIRFSLGLLMVIAFYTFSSRR